MQETTITVMAKNVYGSTLYYPICDKSRIFADIMGTKTITARGLAPGFAGVEYGNLAPGAGQEKGCAQPRDTGANNRDLRLAGKSAAVTGIADGVIPRGGRCGAAAPPLLRRAQALPPRHQPSCPGG